MSNKYNQNDKAALPRRKRQVSIAVRHYGGDPERGGAERRFMKMAWHFGTGAGLIPLPISWITLLFFFSFRKKTPDIRGNRTKSSQDNPRVDKTE